jgi:very-short-patch-repair endonuclease
MKKQSTLSSGVIFLQRVDDNKIRQARELRQKMTLAEHALWQRLRSGRNRGLKFRRQQIIEGFIVDFFCHESKLVIEVDGDIHETQKQKEIDKHRMKVFAARGLQEIRFRNSEVMDEIDRVVELIYQKAILNEK